VADRAQSKSSGENQTGGKEVDALDVDVLNIWEATWEDFGYVKGIVGA
jgi:hypothetical protein